MESGTGRPKTNDFLGDELNEANRDQPHFRRRSHTLAASAAMEYGPRLPKSNLLRVARDPIQPTQGSISDLKDLHLDETDEEVDTFFSFMTPPRSRAHTCPEALAKIRKCRVKSLRRPPTPPPTNSGQSTPRLFASRRWSSQDDNIPEDPERVVTITTDNDNNVKCCLGDNIADNANLNLSTVKCLVNVS